MHLVRTTSTAKAQDAYNALKSGQSWDTVATKYSASAVAAKNGGLLTGVSAGEEETAVNAAIFGSPVGKIVGPIKGVLGSYVIEVDEDHSRHSEDAGAVLGCDQGSVDRHHRAGR